MPQKTDTYCTPDYIKIRLWLDNFPKVYTDILEAKKEIINMHAEVLSIIERKDNCKTIKVIRRNDNNFLNSLFTGGNILLAK